MDYSESIWMSNPKVSIVMAYYDRSAQLLVTLNTIQKSAYKNIEVIIVDDCSSQGEEPGRFKAGFSDMDIKVITLVSEGKNWCNPSYVFNRGFEKASGDIVIIQNPESFHVGNLISEVVQNLKEKIYRVYSCKSLTASQNNKFSKLYWDNAESGMAWIRELSKNRSRWYTHPEINPMNYHFLSAIYKKDLDEFGGFDERYANGYSFDDNEFLERMKRSPFEIISVLPHNVFSVHQWHVCTHPPAGNKDEGWKRNYRLFHNMTKKETTWKANCDS